MTFTVGELGDVKGDEKKKDNKKMTGKKDFDKLIRKKNDNHFKTGIRMLTHVRLNSILKPINSKYSAIIWKLKNINENCPVLL